MFNGWAQGCQTVVVEEIRVVGQNRHEVMNRLKPCITNDTVSIRDLNKPVQQVPNNVNYIMFTNFHDSLAVGKGERRYFVLNSRIQTERQVLELGSTYFTTLFDSLKDNAAGLRAWFENWKISDKFNPNGHAPVTKYLMQLIDDTATPLNTAISETVADGEHPLIKPDLLSSRALQTIVEMKLGTRTFTSQQIGSALYELGYVKLCRLRLDDNERHYMWAVRGSPYAGATAAKIRIDANKRLASGPVMAPDGSAVDFDVLS